MEKGINYATTELKMQISQAIDNSKLPITNVRYAMEEVLRAVMVAEKQQVEKEKSDYEKSLADTKK